MILDKAWQAGIPHVTFTGGEATLREDLPDLIAHAEKNGQVCGLLTDGLRLIDKNYLDLLLQTGLDHILFLLQPDNDKSWAALEKVMAEDIFVTAHLTLNRRQYHECRRGSGTTGKVGCKKSFSRPVRMLRCVITTMPSATKLRRWD